MKAIAIVVIVILLIGGFAVKRYADWQALHNDVEEVFSDLCRSSTCAGAIDIKFTPCFSQYFDFDIVRGGGTLRVAHMCRCLDVDPRVELFPAESTRKALERADIGIELK